MPKPHKCPVCDGEGQVRSQTCKACKGTCIVWEPVNEFRPEDFREYIDPWPLGPQYHPWDVVTISANDDRFRVII